jgi:hypothetical protein
MIGTGATEPSTGSSADRAGPGVRWPALPRVSGWAIAVAAVVLFALAVRLWGITGMLPAPIEGDELTNFVDPAVHYATGHLEPGSFINPPGVSYFFYVVFGLVFGFGRSMVRAQHQDPSQVLLVARVTSAFVGALAVWLVYVAGRRLLDRRVGLVAAALLAVAFLPVFYSHLALNDDATIVPVTIALIACGGILARGRTWDYVLAGASVGLAAGAKYTAGYVIVSVIVAGIGRMKVDGVRGPLMRLLVGLVVAAVAFLIVNPYAVLDFERFRQGLVAEAGFTSGSLSLGETQRSGSVYYAWSLSWGIGWVPLVLGAIGAMLLMAKERWIAALLVPAPVIYLVIIASQGRYFGRWLLPTFPMLVLLAAFAVLSLADLCARRWPRSRVMVIALGTVALCGQSAVHVIHDDVVLSRASTNSIARDWIIRRVPPGSRIVVEPFAPGDWLKRPGRQYVTGIPGLRYLLPPVFEFGLDPKLIDSYIHAGYCWVVAASTQAGRALVDPMRVPRSVAYYRALARRGTLTFRVSPFSPAAHLGVGTGPVAFQFDWSYDFYPLSYRRPGATISVYRLHGGRCNPR